jgi:hypothetical protein
LLTDGHLTVGVHQDGLIARIGAEQMAAAVVEPDVRPLQHDGRPMPGIAVVASNVLDSQSCAAYLGHLNRWSCQLPSPATSVLLRSWHREVGLTGRLC